MRGVSRMSVDPNVQALAKMFSSSWDPMVGLMNRARSVEFKIRLAAEVLSQQTFSKAKTFDEFMKGERMSRRKKMDKHIQDVFGNERERLILIRQCADSLAHADYLTARRRIDEYKEKFGLASELTDRKAGLIFYQNVKHPDGEISGVGYILGSSDQNLILEEFEVFKQQGYFAAAEEMLGYAEAQLETIVPKLDIKYASLVAQRGLKYGVRQKN